MQTKSTVFAVLSFFVILLFIYCMLKIAFNFAYILYNIFILYALNFNQICIAGLAACVAARDNDFVALTK